MILFLARCSLDAFLRKDVSERFAEKTARPLQLRLDRIHRAVQRDHQLNQQDSESNESWAELLEAIAAVDVTLCLSCGANAVQRGPLPSPRPLGARAPPEVAA